MIRRTGGKSVTLHSNDSILGFKLTQDEKFWRQQKKIMLKALGNAPELLITQGVTQAGVGVTFNLVNKTVLETAKSYIDPWWEQIETASRDMLRDAITRNIESGKPLKDLIADLETVFGPTRANTIATTEVTRLFSEGNAIAYEAGGVEEYEWRAVNDGLVDEECDELDGQRFPISSDVRPPAHVNCRCFTVPV